MKKLFLIIAAITLCSVVFAGGYFTNTNQNAHFLRNPARGASSTEIDAVFSNPAGLSLLDHEGLTISVNNQSAFQTRTATTTFAPFVMNGSDATKEYEGKATAPFVPSVLAAYKWNDFVFSGSFSIVGGGGMLKFKNGLPMFEAGIAAPLAQIQAAAMGVGYTGAPLGYSLNMSLEGASITYGTQLGITYKINDMFSAFLGARASFVSNSYDGSLNNVSVANADAVRNHLLFVAGQLAGGTPEQQATAMALQGAAAGIMQVQNTTLELDTKQSGWGIAPILGLNFNYEELNVGVKYDFNTNIEIENSTKINTTPLLQFNDGVKSDYDIPALFSIGASYKFLNDKLTASAGYHILFDKNADYASANQKNLDSNLQEWLAGLEYKICDRVLVSAGGQLSRTGVTDAWQSDLSFTSDSYSIGMGTKINITEKLSANLAYFVTIYEDYTKPDTFGPVSKTVYSRTNNAFGIGLDYKF